ncbi:MAG: N-glycosylase/DNA lyase, partial [Candidatus Odinarchaeota archaeon]|nr:N-glycosylase/DNA lyase [Candidatus Odinarchaeota archaeon]
MEKMIKKVKLLLNSEKLRKKVEERMMEFEDLGKKGNEEWFIELCFCILTANSSAELCIKIQNEVGMSFLTLSKEELSRKLRSMGYRYYIKRAEYIVDARRYSNSIKDIVESFGDEFLAREWLVSNVKGLGYKEASHFLRNVGFKNVAIIDRHILRCLYENGVIEKIPKNLSKKDYMRIEKLLRELSEKTGLSLSELDLFLWYTMTGKVLK